VASPESFSLLMLDDFFNDCMFDIQKPSFFDALYGNIDHEIMFMIEFTLSC
jgi:hypothetical protein